MAIAAAGFAAIGAKDRSAGILYHNYGLLMRAVMMVDEIFFLVALGFGIYTASLANSVFANPVAQIGAAGSGSILLSQVQAIHAIEGWLVPLKLFGASTEFLAIAMGLSTIIYNLGSQTNMLDSLLSGRQTAS